MHYSSILPEVLKIADAASVKVMSIYMTDFKVDFKADESPITAADIASHNVIVEGLSNLSQDIPILPEEKAKPWTGTASLIISQCEANSFKKDGLS